jgi:hypothetical protein
MKMEELEQMKIFEPFGPYKLPTLQKMIDDEKKSCFWDAVEEKTPGLSGAVGCYIFAIRAGRGATPWYVGKAEKTTFRNETWNPRNLNTFSKILHKHGKGTPILYLLAKRTTGGRFRRPTKSRIGDVSFLEKMLIGTCLSRNLQLANISMTRYHVDVCVPGYMNGGKGKRSSSARSLADLLQGKKLTASQIDDLEGE